MRRAPPVQIRNDPYRFIREESTLSRNLYSIKSASAVVVKVPDRWHQRIRAYGGRHCVWGVHTREQLLHRSFEYVMLLVRGKIALYGLAA